MYAVAKGLRDISKSFHVRLLSALNLNAPFHFVFNSHIIFLFSFSFSMLDASISLSLWSLCAHNNTFLPIVDLFIFLLSFLLSITMTSRQTKLS